MAAFQFNANSAFAKAFNSRQGNYIALSEVQPITDPRFTSKIGETGTVYSTGTREKDGSDILWISFPVLDGFERPIEFKLDVPTCMSLNIKAGDTVNKSDIVGLKAISNGPTKEPTTVMVVNEVNHCE